MTLDGAKSKSFASSPWIVGLGIAFAYCVTGKLGLLLAIPPGYATAIWPASGIALAALVLFGGRYWPAIWLGSFLTNILIAFNAPDASTAVTQLLTAFAIGAGASAQAYVGFALIRKTISLPVQLIVTKEVFRFLALGGPAACIVNATWGVGVLVAAGSIPVSGIAYSWWTWWVGDTIGVLIFAPLALMWTDRSSTWRSRRWIVTASLGATFLAAVMVFVYVSRSEWNGLKRNFDKNTEEIAAAIGRRVELHAKNLESIANLFAASKQVNREEFRRFTRSMVSEHGDVLGVGWIPRVVAAERHAVEAQLPASARHPYFFEMQPPWPRAADRDEHAPVLFFTPRTTVDTSGFDLNSEETRRNTLATARDSGTFTASPMLAMTLTPGSPSDGFLLVQPIFARDDLSTVEERRLHLRGYAIGFFKLSEFLGHRDVTSIAGDRMHFDIADVTDRTRPVVVFRYAANGNTALLLDMTSNIELEVGGRNWRLSFTPTLGYVTGTTTVVVWLVLAGGLLFSALVGVGALILTGRTSEIEALVRQRTDELAVSNEKLSVEISEHVRTETTLREQHTFIQLILDNLSEGVIAYDSRGAMTLSNSGARRTLDRVWGQSDDPTHTHQATELFETEGGTAGSSPLTRALEGEVVIDCEIVTAVPNRRGVVLMASTRPILNALGSRNGALLLLRDVTESRASERLKREFISVVSHELRTPLTSIRGSLGLVISGAVGELSPAVKNLTTIAVRNCDRLAVLINDLLDIEKIEAGHLSLNMQALALGSLVTQALEANAGYAREHGVQFAKVSAAENDEELFVKADAHRLLQVLANLLSNAAKFSPQGATVDIGVQVRGAQVRVFVRDSGGGIPFEFRSRIFEKFSQADSSDARAKHGTGLGLAISKALIERMGGRIDYVTETGRGTTFFFDLPLIDRESSAQIGAA